ncbi:retrovirus-related pol polyprotein from type-1 retrotransposable element r2 [Plakobranchus ocellatus]|uniref:Retrovirus-related pol polyprotein from type-1 retrotransposable element r2 n=1 Tax=Plakobranchus ocellatus TaxID=259542 RepID=A0AAV3XZM0_9GAST|nr:retrovirus-related pol polyprotein from type-1 retrotransposable element r2 [Plakobranchus ocellatus]
MRNLENHPGIKVGGQNINNLRYADDTVLIAENKEDLQKLLNIVEEESRKKGLELNSKKTEGMVSSRKQESPKCDIFVNKVKLGTTSCPSTTLNSGYLCLTVPIDEDIQRIFFLSSASLL